MKNLLKAVALATVMCMLLSVSAFAATVEVVGSADKDTANDYTVDVEVIAPTGEQVAVLIVKSTVDDLADVTDNDIVYINQDVAANNAVVFSDVEIDNETDTVDVWVGSSTISANNSNAAVKLADNLEIVAGTTITFTKATVEDEILAENGEIGAYAIVQFDMSANATITDLAWAFKVDDSNNPYRYYVSKGVNIAGVAGAVNVAAVFKNGTYTKVAGGNVSYSNWMAVTDAGVILNVDGIDEDVYVNVEKK